MKALSIGRLIYDVNILLDTYPVEGKEINTKDIISCSGGTANIIAYSLSKWNVETFISGVIGYDEIGTTMKKNMEENKIRTNYLETNYDIKTPTSYIFINKENNSHTIINEKINDFTIKKYDYDTDMDLVVVDGYEYNASIYAFNKYNNAITLLNAKEPHNGLLDFFKYAKYVVVASKVAEAMTGLKMDFNNPLSLTNVYKKIIDKYPHITLIILMEEKGTIYSIENEIKILASIKSEVSDASNAQDIFTAMVGYGITMGYSIETTIRLATIAESLFKKSIGSTNSIPILSDIINYYENKFGNLERPEEEKESLKFEEPNTQIDSLNNQSFKEQDHSLNSDTDTTNDEEIVSQVFGMNPNDFTNK